MENSKPLWHNNVSRFLSTHAPELAPEIINAMITANMVRWETPLKNGQKLALLRLSHPVIDREEIFVGNVLFNDWLNKSLPTAVEQAGLGTIQFVINDLETAYFLLVTTADLSAIAEAYRAYLLIELPNLFFANNNPARGYHGNFSNMFTFLKSDFEPFPIYALPLFLARPLEKKVRVIFDELLQKPYLKPDRKGKIRPTTAFRTLQAIMAFFYGRTSGGSGDCQSHPTFVARMVTEYGLLSLDKIWTAFNLPTEKRSTQIKQGDLKELIQTSINEGQFSEEKVRDLFQQVRDTFVASIENESEEKVDLLQSWLVPFLRRDRKFIDISPADYLASLLHRVGLGEIALDTGITSGERCRLCGDQGAIVDEKNILLGVSVGKFHNRTANNPKSHNKRLCPRCALYSYLTTKQLGSTSVGKFPVPKLGNIIFHYGQYTPAEVQTLQKRINYLIKTIQKRNAVRYEHLSSPKEEIRKLWNPQKEKEVVEAKLIELCSQEGGDPAEIDRLSQRLTELFEETKKFGVVEALIPNADVIHVLDLGLGQWRLVAFAMEQLKDEKDLAQKRFVAGRLQVYSLLSFLQFISEEEPESSGPYYFQSIPQLGDPNMDHRDTFYVRDRPVSASRYRRLYQAISIFANSVTRGGGQGHLRDTLKLAAELEKSPLETFSAVIRDSPFRFTDDLRDGKYQVFKDNDAEQLEPNRDLRMYDGWPYLGVYYALKELAETE